MVHTMLTPWKGGRWKVSNCKARRSASQVGVSSCFRIGVLIGALGDRNALWFFIAAIVAAAGSAAQNYALMKAASDLTAKLRALIFQATLRQDSERFHAESSMMF